jgi:hypothetical protein
MPAGSSLLLVVLVGAGCADEEPGVTDRVVVVSEAGDEMAAVVAEDAGDVSTVVEVGGPAQALISTAPIRRPTAVRSSAVRDVGPSIFTIVHDDDNVDTAGSLPIPWQACIPYC